MPPSSDELRDSFSSLSVDLRSEMAELDRLRTDKHRQERVASQVRDDERHDLLKQFLTSQVQEVENRDTATKWRAKFLWTPFVTAMLGGGGFVGVQNYRTPPEPAPTEANAEPAETPLAQRVHTLERELVQLRLIQARMALLHIDQNALISDVAGYLSLKLDTIHPRGRRVSVPMSLEDARKSAWKMKQLRTPFSGYDPIDPIGDLLKDPHHGN